MTPRKSTAWGRRARSRDARRSAVVGIATREAALVARDTSVSEREVAAASRNAELDAREPLLGQMRDANEQLVLTTLRERALADVASSARAAAEQARAELEVAKLALLEASRRKDEFLAMLGHELRNPLAPILTALELMNAKSDASTLREREVIERQVRHVVELVDDLLDVSRITSGNVRLKKTAVDVANFVARAVETASPLLESRRHAFTVSMPQVPVLVHGDATRLAQVVANLLTNAAKYTEPGGTIALSATEEAGGWLRIRVRDDGVGIGPELMPHVFDLFTQGSQSVDRAGGGLGLGLAIVRSLVELHDGEVAVTSMGRGHGTEVVVRLPTHLGHAAHGGTPVTDEIEPTRAARTVPLRVLVVDDNYDAADMLAEALRASGHVAEISHDAPHALRTAEAFLPDVVVLDIGLPVVDGYELARLLRAEEPHLGRLRLIAVTGYGQESDRARSAAAGIDVHLVKPVDFATLEAALVAGPDDTAIDAAVPSTSS